MHRTVTTVIATTAVFFAMSGTSSAQDRPPKRERELEPKRTADPMSAHAHLKAMGWMIKYPGQLSVVSLRFDEEKGDATFFKIDGKPEEGSFMIDFHDLGNVRPSVLLIGFYRIEAKGDDLIVKCLVVPTKGEYQRLDFNIPIASLEGKATEAEIRFDSKIYKSIGLWKRNSKETMQGEPRK